MSTLSNIVEQGEDVKYKITISQQGFVQNDDNFQVTLKWGMLGKELTITKDEMISDSDDNWYFMFSTADMVGRVKALCSYDVPDGDYPEGYRTETDLQCICVVITHPLPARICVPSGETTTPVTYERTEESDVAELYSELVDSRGAVLVTSDNEELFVLKR